MKAIHHQFAKPSLVKSVAAALIINDAEAPCYEREIDKSTMSAWWRSALTTQRQPFFLSFSSLCSDDLVKKEGNRTNQLAHISTERTVVVR